MKGKTVIPRTLKYYRVLDRRGVSHERLEYPAGELIAITEPTQRILQWILKKRIERAVDPKSGRCKCCGCTWGRACQGGCYWANEQRTMCSQCSEETFGN